MILRRLARWILRDELAQLRGGAAFTRRCFHAWRDSAWIWEKYARHLEDQHGLENGFEGFFWSLTSEERHHPATSDYVPGFLTTREKEHGR